MMSDTVIEKNTAPLNGPDQPIESNGDGSRRRYDCLQLSLMFALIAVRLDSEIVGSIPVNRHTNEIRLWKFSSPDSFGDYARNLLLEEPDFPASPNEGDVRLQAFPADRCPPYVALSYMWGSHDRCILVNGYSLSITANLTL
jgi:hypothetical protein